MVSIHNSRMDNLLLDRKTKEKKEIILLLLQLIHRNGTVLEMNSKSNSCSHNSNSSQLPNPLSSNRRRFHNLPMI